MIGALEASGAWDCFSVSLWRRAWSPEMLGHFECRLYCLDSWPDDDRYRLQSSQEVEHTWLEDKVSMVLCAPNAPFLGS